MDVLIMTFFALILAVGNIFLAGMHWGIILSNRNEGNAVPGRMYTFSFMHLITGCYLLLAAVGSAA